MICLLLNISKKYTFSENQLRILNQRLRFDEIKDYRSQIFIFFLFKQNLYKKIIVCLHNNFRIN